MLTLAGLSLSDPPLAISGTAVMPPVPPEVAVVAPVPVMPLPPGNAAK